MHFNTLKNKWIVSGIIALALSAPLGAQTPGDSKFNAPDVKLPIRAKDIEALMNNEENLIEQRTRAEAALAANPEDFNAYLLLGFVLHRAEGDLARSRYNLEKASKLSKKKLLSDGGTDALLCLNMSNFELLQVLTEMDDYQGKISHLEELIRVKSNPLFMSEMAWPLMKLGREEEAREIIQKTLYSDMLSARLNSWNTLGALESELSHHQASYDAFKGLINELERNNLPPNITFYRNIGESCMPLGRYEEAEKYYKIAASLPFEPASFTNPHQDLTALYLGQARFSEAINSLKKTFEWSGATKPFLYQQSMAENAQLRGITQLELGLPAEAVQTISLLVQRPDRRGGTSVHIDQSEAGNLVCWYVALQTNLQRNKEQLSSTSIWSGLITLARYGWYKYIKRDKNTSLDSDSLYVKLVWNNWEMRRQISQASKRIAALTAENGRIRYSMCPYEPQSIDIFEWLRPNIVGMLGTGLCQATIDDIQKNPPENIQFIQPFLGILSGEIAYINGDNKKCIELLSNALKTLPKHEALLALRSETRLAMALQERGELSQAMKIYADILRRDGAKLRELGARLPVKLQLDTSLFESDLGRDLTKFIKRSPRFTIDSSGFILNISQNTPNELKVSISDESNNSIKSFTIPLGNAKDEILPTAQIAMLGLHDGLCAPEITVSGLDDSLDGSNFQSSLRNLIQYR